MENLPRDVLVDILVRLPVKTLARLRCVCKPWLSLISARDFAKFRLDESRDHCKRLLLKASCLYALDYKPPPPPQPPSLAPPPPPQPPPPAYAAAHHDADDDYFDDFDDDNDDIAATGIKLELPYKIQGRELHVVGSCDGLVCLLHYQNSFYIYNPSIRDCKELPDPGDFPCGMQFYGFGYDSSVDDYKVVKAVFDRYRASRSVVRVYSLRTNSWKGVQDCPWYLSGQSSGFYVDGAIHWLVNDFREVQIIAAFDLAKEKFMKLPLPEFCERNKWSMLSLGALEDTLCLFRAIDNGRYAELWAMVEYGVRESWTKGFRIPSPKCLDNLFMLDAENDKLLLHMDLNKVAWYDQENETFENVVIKVPSILYRFQVIMYEESLISPNAYGNNGNRVATASISENVKIEQ